MFSFSRYLFSAVQESISDVPAQAVVDGQTPGKCGLVEVDEQAEGQVAQQDVLVVETGAGQAEVGGQARQQQGQVAEARHGRDEWRGGRGPRVRDVHRYLQVPQGLRYGGGRRRTHLRDGDEMGCETCGVEKLIKTKSYRSC